MSDIPLILKTFYAWPQSNTELRKCFAFKATYSETRDLLNSELRHLGAASAVVQLNVRDREIRLDGELRVGAQPSHPGVILSCESKHGALQYLCDDCVSWQHNLRAIAKTLERLRLAELYGVAKRGEQYRGWSQLPAPEGRLTRERASAFIVEKSQLDVPFGPSFLSRSPDDFLTKKVVNAAIVNCHPDKAGGSQEDFIKLQQCRQVLGV